MEGHAQSSEECLDCHLSESNGNRAESPERTNVFEESVHSDFSCVDCHVDLAGSDNYPHEEELSSVDCSSCHDDIGELFAGSAHSPATDNPKAPSCSSCHGTHGILSHTDPQAPTSAQRLPYTCSACHTGETLNGDPDIKVIHSFDSYMRGIHAEGIARGIGSAASCVDCHGVHDLKKASDPLSKVNKMNIPKTCSSCHNDIYLQYARGIHGKALATGILDSPNCADCHGEHEILQVDDPDSPVNAANLSDYVCGRCHNDPQLVKKYGLSDGRFTSYQDSYHGLAVRGGSVKAANCVSCHRAHDILPMSNPASSVHANNLTATCAKCHPKANDAFAESYSHQMASAEYDKLNTIIGTLYIVLIVVVIAAMLLHNLIILGRYIIEKRRRQKTMPVVQRMTGNMVYQHMVVTVAFIVLVITGFALKYPDVWWVSVLNFFGIFESARSLIHRIAAVFLIYISVHHALFMWFSRRGREELHALYPRLQDLKDVGQNLKYYLGLVDSKPRFDRYDYTEKAEYWALAWGTVIMAVTGFVLWFPIFFTSFLPAWIIKISETIHFYEAWLATLAVAVFHFFFVIFHPEQYPMSLTWLTGQMTVKEMQEHHPAWYDRVKEMEQESQAETGPDQPDDDSTDQA